MRQFCDICVAIILFLYLIINKLQIFAIFTKLFSCYVIYIMYICRIN